MDKDDLVRALREFSSGTDSIQTTIFGHVARSRAGYYVLLDQAPREEASTGFRNGAGEVGYKICGSIYIDMKPSLEDDLVRACNDGVVRMIDGTMRGSFENVGEEHYLQLSLNIRRIVKI
ncbi:hypothetical protein COV20_00545 [Candidatus Woesearchaeota archaeon CG10_big_fil_rev_8_21_14_0_10_45_16]|nr:MAG: hypothetical protein COV20_00545 [Candidatus Woesearchaeota archaeon CG10_big_fil_rev_8_21_14_0_10_45_16]